jgi:hypothetical protein
MRLRLGLALTLAFVLGCDPLGGVAEVRFELPRERWHDFLDVPWPSDALRTDDGLDLSAFPNPYGSSTLDDYVALFSSSPGYSTSGALYFQVEGGVDESSLPQSPRESVAADATMFLVTLADPSRRVPIEWQHYPEGTAFLPPGSMAVLPLLGAIVDGPAALVVTSRARAADGRALGASSDLRALLRCEPLDGLTAQPDCEAYEALPAKVGLSADEIALLQIFTPQDATAPLKRGFEVVTARAAASVKDFAIYETGYQEYVVFTGTVDLAQFQAGSAPYNDFDGVTGGFVLDDDGRPIVQREETVEVVVTVPRGPPPDAGWPLVINGHGTTGSLLSGLGDGAYAEAHQLARAGCAMLATSEPLHLGREGYVEGGEQLNTFNFLNPVSGRDIWLQSALEKAQLVSAAKAMTIPAVEGSYPAVHFDPEQVHYFGHSQGGIVGALFVGVEDRIGGAFLSGAGGGFAPSLIEKTQPVRLAEVVRTLLSLPDDEPLDRFHPVPNLMQIWVDPLEPLNFGAAWRHRPERATPHLVMTSGLDDSYTPPRNHAALAAAFGLPPVEPVALNAEVLQLAGLDPVAEEAAHNLRTARGEPLTGGLLQYPDDGHFAVFSNPDAQAAYLGFFQTLVAGAPVGRVR